MCHLNCNLASYLNIEIIFQIVDNAVMCQSALCLSAIGSTVHDKE